MSHQPMVLFICTGNAGRSQMAEALCRRMAGEGVTVISAGVEPWADLHPVAVRLMRERGIDMSGHAPKPVSTWAQAPLDLVVTLGDRARELTPELPGMPRRIHWEIADPADYDDAEPARQEQAFRAAMTAIEQRLPDLLATLKSVPLARRLHLTPALSTMFVRPAMFQPRVHFPLLAQAGFRAVELCCYLGARDFPWEEPAMLQEALEVARDHGISITSFHAVGDWITHADPRRTRLMIDLAKTGLDVAAMLGAGVVAIHAGLPSGLERDRGEAVLRAALAELEAHALPIPCHFGWENEAQGMTAEEHLAMLRDYNPDAISLVLDTGHANLTGDTATYLSNAGARLCSLHLNDNDGRADLHQAPGRGTANWDGFLSALLATGYTGPLTMEVQSGAGEDLPAFLRETYAAYAGIREAVRI